MAQHRGWEGTVLLDIEMLPDGTVGEVTIAQSSGHPLLDTAAQETNYQLRVTSYDHYLTSDLCLRGIYDPDHSRSRVGTVRSGMGGATLAWLARVLHPVAAGIAETTGRGVVGGGWRGVSPSAFQTARQWLEIATTFNVNRSTIYRLQAA